MSAFNAILVFGLCDLKGTYVQYFEFHLSELSQLYEPLILWMKHFSGANEELQIEGIIIKRLETSYCWKKLIIDNSVVITLTAKEESSIKIQISFSYEKFNKFVQSLYFLTWQTLSLSELNQNILLPLMLLSFEDLFELRKPENSILYLKSINKKSSSYTSVILFHIGTLLFLHKVRRLINYEAIDETLKVLNVS